jgi:threonine aldolase
MTCGSKTPAPPTPPRKSSPRRRRGGLVYPVEANEVFLNVSADEAASLRAQGFDFYDWGPGEIRLVTSWDQQGEHVDRLAAAIAAL